MMAKRHVVSSESDEGVLKLIVVVDAKLYEDIKNHLIVHGIWMNCMLRELYLKAVLKILCSEYSLCLLLP